MTHETANDERASLGTADPDLERLLSDAYDAPAAPRSLLKRIDEVFEAEWGESPIRANGRTGRLSRLLRRGRRWAKAVPVAAGLAACIVLAVVFSGDSRAFGWASMMEALARQGVVQWNGPDGSRWLSLQDGVVGERTAESSRMLDARRQVVLERPSGAAEILRRRFRLPNQSAMDVSAADRNLLMLGFLLGDRVSEENWRQFAGAKVASESWERVTAGGREEIVLHVQFETPAAGRFGLRMAVDPDSQLPTGCDVLLGDGEARSLAFSYPRIEPAQLRERDFPSELRVVDVRQPGGEVLRTAANEQRSTKAPGDGSTVPDPDSKDRSTNTDDEGTIEGVANSQRDARRPPMSGDPSEWAAVEIVNRSTQEVVHRVDSVLAELWRENGVRPTALADDEELLRRVYLDLVGRTPTVREVRSYLNDNSADRYERLVDRLLKSPDHASHLATVWRNFLIPEGVDLTAFGGVEAFDQWLAERFAAGESYDNIVGSLLLAEGRLSRSGPLLFYSAARLDSNRLASRTARVFLGMRLECAQCHDHPFEAWTQQEFWGFAAFFARISRPQTELESVSTVMRVHDVDYGEVMLPETEIVVAPKLLDGSEIGDDGQGAARREQLVRWLTDVKNPYLARATANRVWGHMFGKGIVDPIDDFGFQNAPKSPELLELLAGHFLGTGFDLRELFRTVALSKAYRLSSGAATVDETRLDCFAQMNVKTLTAEQVYDCIIVASMLDSPAVGEPYEFNVTRFGNTEREVFLQQFRTPGGRRTEYLGGIPQALTLMNGALIENATGLSSSGLLKSLEAPFFTNDERIEVLYLSTLSRRPRPSEWRLLRGYIPQDASGAELREGLADILWALLNSAEFTMNH